MIAVAAVVFVNGSAWAQAVPGKTEAFDIFSQSTVVDGRPAFITQFFVHQFQLRNVIGNTTGFVFSVTVFYDTFVEQYSGSSGVSPSGFKVSEQLDSARVQVEDVPFRKFTCEPDFTNCVESATTADVDIHGVGDGEVFEEFFGPDLSCEIQPSATATGSVVTESGINILGDNVLSAGMSQCRGMIE
jgi:hypothetical protein